MLTTHLPGLRVSLQGYFFEPALFKIKAFYFIFKKVLKNGNKKFLLKKSGSKKKFLVLHVNLQIVVTV